ncbi:MAG: glutamate carboxypeptidase [Parvibaculaceae bacterium]
MPVRNHLTLRRMLAAAACLCAVVSAHAMDSGELLRRADALTPSYLKTVEEMVAIDSPTHFMPGIEKMTQVIARRMTELGGETRIVPASVDQGNNLIGTWRGTGKGDILLLAHMDTVHKEGSAAEWPFRSDGKRAFGPGVLDDKGGIALGLASIDLLRRTGFTEFGRITFLVNSDEERGSFGSRDLIGHLAREHDVAFVLEFGSPADKVTSWRKGIAYFKLEVTGKAAHAGAEPEKGCNALAEAAHQVLQLGKLGDPAKETTINFTVIKAGDRPNIIPDKAFAQADVRILHPRELARLEADYKRLAEKKLFACTKVAAIVEHGRPPFPPSPGTDALVKKAQGFYREIGIELGVEGSGGATDGNYSAAAGTVTLDALGPVGGGAHTRDEYIDIDRIGPRIYLLARLIMDAATAR